MIFDIFGTKRRRTVTAGDKNYLIRISRGKCEYCGCDIIGRGITPHIHHIVPVASGGSDRYHNLIVLCPNCHSKADHIPKDEFRAKIQYRLQKKRTSQSIAAQTASTKKETRKKTTQKKTTTKKKTLKKSPTKKAPTKKVTTKKTAPKKSTTKKTIPKKATTKKTSTKKSTKKKSSSRKTTSKKK